ncbi:galactose metabolism- protein [Dispira parvispora]|uniref:Galactose metabolism- protein n=1 Tax=Dispira parvispora TaxID=1520584 RepID=A0A9W8AU49_9FUNG|nr:galactose metabolism- protein [Dispira parvispora]
MGNSQSHTHGQHPGHGPPPSSPQANPTLTHDASPTAKSPNRKRHTIQAGSFRKPVEGPTDPLSDAPQGATRPVMVGPSTPPKATQGIPIAGSLSGSPAYGGAQSRGKRSVSLRYKGGRYSPSLASPAQPTPLFACESPSMYGSSLTAHTDPTLGPEVVGDITKPDTMDLDVPGLSHSSAQAAPRPILSQRRSNAVPEFFPATLPSASVCASSHSVTAVQGSTTHPPGVMASSPLQAPPVTPSDVRKYGTTPTPSRPPGLPLPSSRKAAVSTSIKWKGSGQTVYISGSFNDWRHKIRLHPTSSGIFSVAVTLQPGVHFFKFIVDDEWRCSPYFATAPDDDGNLVNYVRVEGTASTTTSPRTGPTSTGIPSTPSAGRTPPNATSGSPQATVELGTPLIDVNQTIAALDGLELESVLSNSPPGEYTLQVPEHLYLGRRGSAPGQHHQTTPKNQHPPTLPPHLSQVLLNHSHSHHNALSNSNHRLVDREETNTSLPVPNHVVLNHLFACSIRNGVMAIASTTRYRKKYTTTVYYKPFNPQ